MPTPMQLIHADISSEMISKIDAVIAAHQNTRGAAIPVLRLCQDIVGYLPVELIDYISAGLNLPQSEVFGVVTFYSLFSLIPRGRHAIKACLGTACYVKGIREIMNRISSEYDLKEGETSEDRRFSLEAVRCLGACGLAPVVVVDQDTHGGVTPSQVKPLLEQYV